MQVKKTIFREETSNNYSVTNEPQTNQLISLDYVKKTKHYLLDRSEKLTIKHRFANKHLH